MVKKFLNFQSKSVSGAAFVLGAAFFLSAVLGVLRDRILASRFGAGDELDIYYAAFKIPDLVYAILSLGAVSAGFIPVFTDYLNRQDRQDKNSKNQWYLASSVFNLLGLVLIAVCIPMIIFAPIMMKWVAPGFSAEKLALTTRLSRIMFLSPILLGLSAVLGGILQSLKKFLAYALAPILYNLSIIFGALFLTGRFGLMGLAYGVVLGAFLHFVFQASAGLICGFRWRPIFDWRFEGVKRVFKVTPWRVLNLGLAQINSWAVTIFASYLAAGSIAVYNLAYNIWGFPLGVLGIPFSTAAFPHLSQKAQEKDFAGFNRIFKKTVNQVLFFTLFLTVVFLALRTHLVSVILTAGRFGPNAASLTAQTIGCLMLSLTAESLIYVFLKSFFAFEDTKTPFLISLLSVSRLFLAWRFARFWGVAGLALGFSLGSILYSLILCLGLRVKFKIHFGGIFISFLKMFFCSVLSFLAMSGFLKLNLISGSGIWQTIAGGCMAGTIGLLIYLPSIYLIKVEGINLREILIRKKSDINPKIT